MSYIIRRGHYTIHFINVDTEFHLNARKTLQWSNKKLHYSVQKVSQRRNANIVHELMFMVRMFALERALASTNASRTYNMGLN